MKKSHLAAALVAITLPFAVGCGGSKDIASGDSTTSPSSPSTSSPSSPRESTSTSSSTSPSPPSSSTSDGSAGQLDGTGFTVQIPPGWKDTTASGKAKNAGLDVAMAESNPSGFATNFNVVKASQTSNTLEKDGDALRKEAASELKSFTHQPVTPLSDRTIDGSAALGQTSTFASGGTAVTFFQYLTIHNGRAYPITMTFATANKTSAAATLGAILDSWQWSS